MRFLAALVLTASIVVAALVLTAPAKAAWSAPVSIGAGERPAVRIDANHHYVALQRGRQIRVLQDGNAQAAVTIPKAGALSAFDIDGNGTVLALRLDRRAKKLLALVEGSWRRISPRGGTPVDPQLAVAESGAAAAVWLQYEGRRISVHAAVRGPNARRFLPAQRISGPVKRGGQPISVGVDSAGDAVVAFVEKRDLFMWRLGLEPVKIHDATDVVAGAFATAAAVASNAAVVAFTRLEDLEPPQYRASVAVQAGESPPAITKIADNVSALDLFADRFGGVFTAPIGPPYAINATGDRTWPATEAPSSIRADGSVVAWTEGTAGFAVVGEQKLALGRAYNPDVAESPDQRRIVAWDGGPARSARYAVFTP